MRDPLMESDPIAERRYAYAKAAALEGDWSAALDVLNQTLERAPEWAAAWFALGEAKEKLEALQRIGAVVDFDLFGWAETRS